MHTLRHVLATNGGEGTEIFAVSEAAALANQLIEWRAEEGNEVQNSGYDSNLDHETTAQIANAYSFSALLVLQNEVLPPQFLEHDNSLYRQALDSVLRTAALDGPMATLVWPLYTVGRYSQSSSDRTILRHIFAKLFNRQHMKIVELASTNMQQEWRSESNDHPRRDSLVFFCMKTSLTVSCVIAKQQGGVAAFLILTCQSWRLSYWQLNNSEKRNVEPEHDALAIF